MQNVISFKTNNYFVCLFTRSGRKKIKQPTENQSMILIGLNNVNVVGKKHLKWVCIFMRGRIMDRLLTTAHMSKTSPRISTTTEISGRLKKYLLLMMLANAKRRLLLVCFSIPINDKIALTAICLALSYPWSTVTPSLCALHYQLKWLSWNNACDFRANIHRLPAVKRCIITWGLLHFSTFSSLPIHGNLLSLM